MFQKPPSRRALLAAILPLFILASTPMSARADTQPGPQPSPSGDMQGDQQRWINDPHTRALYDVTVAAFAHGPNRVNRAKYEQDCRSIFRDFGLSRGIRPEAMEEHLKLIPGQVIQIATDDPSVLSSFGKFIGALFGPQ